MHTRGLSKNLAKEQETVEGRQEEETEAVTNREMEQQVGNGEEARGDTIENPTDKATPTEETKLDNMMRMIMEQFGQIKEESKKQKEDLKQINDKFDRNEESLKPVSYTHLDVYKRQVNRGAECRSICN